MADKRTTITIEENLLKEAKRIALEEDKTLKELVGEALKEKLDVKDCSRKPNFRFKAYNMGEIKLPLTREQIYEDI